MIYDAVLVARRGLGISETRLIDPIFASAVRWAVYAEKLSDGLGELRQNAAAQTPDGLKGAPLVRFVTQRNALREELKKREAALYPPDDEAD